MPRLRKHCAAPRVWNSTQQCGREFFTENPTKLYCSPTCRNRAHRLHQKQNLKARGAFDAFDNPTSLEVGNQYIRPRPPKIDQEDFLATLGYSADPRNLSDARRAELGIEAEPKAKPKVPDSDTAAEPQPPFFDNSDLEDDDPFGYNDPSNL